MRNKRTKRIILWILGSLLVIVAAGAGVVRHYFGDFHIDTAAAPDDPAPMARWPWPQAKSDTPHPGVTRWIDRSSPDGTVVELFDFDFGNNPHLRLELYDQDEDDKVPHDDRIAQFRNKGVAQVTRHLNRTRRGKVVAAWNGLFFQYTGNTASHVAPVVLNGKAYYNVGTVRWAVGVDCQEGKPIFKVLHMPDIKNLAAEYDYAAEGASCLIKDGKPLKLRPFPRPGEEPFPRSNPPAPDESGFVWKVDHIRTSRTSMAWSRDNRHFYLLMVKEADAEAPSIVAFKNRLPLMGGWTVADLQRFWGQFGAWCAVNLDGGDVAQMTAIRRDGRYDLVPPRWAHNSMRLTFSPDFKNAPAGGSIMYFYIRDESMAE